MKGHGILVVLLLGISGVMLILFSGALEGPHPKAPGDRLLSRQASPMTMPPAGTAHKYASPSPQTEKRQAGVEPRNIGTTGSGTVGDDTGRSPRVPVRMADLAKLRKLKLLIKKYAHRYGVDEDLVWAVIRQESGFNPYAVSPKGAMGLMQLMPGTAARMGVSNAFNVEQNLAGGIKYLERCLSQFNQNVPLALAAYNAGPENVVKYQGCPPFAETRNYIVSILQAYKGGMMRADWPAVFNPAVQEGVPGPSGVLGLCWRIPLPHWRIAPPRYKLSSPRWNTTLLPFKLSQPAPPPVRDEVAAN